MKKKQVESLINKIDIENNFDKINGQINYDKYIKANKLHTKRRLNPAVNALLIVGSVYASLVAVFAVDFASTTAHNKKVYAMHEELISADNTSIYQIKSRNDYQTYVSKTEIVLKASLLEKVVNFFDDGLKTMAPGGNEWVDEDMMMPSVDSSAEIDEGAEVPGETMTDTNIQTTGLDEADVSKCDGQYIYSISHHSGIAFEIYDLEGNTVVHEDFENSKNYFELYVHDETIILHSHTTTLFYTFDGNNISLVNEINYQAYNTSRLYEDTLYLVVNDNLDITTEDYEELYYDGITNNAKVVYSIYKYDLNTHTYESVRNLNSGYVTLYASNNHFYLATNVYYTITTEDGNYTSREVKRLTVTSIFDFDLNAKGAIRTYGAVNNQFSMDERNNYFRIVTTNTQAEKERLNAISIYDLETLERVGYLDEGIGEGRQTVRSVTYDDTCCYVVTYENKDPLYKIDLSDVTAPKIVSIYKAPGYSTYLHKFEINGQKYLFGIGYDDDNWTRKISIYIDNGEETIQIGKDYKISEYYYNEVDLFVENVNAHSFNNHKALFVYNDGTDLYLGIKVSYTDYYIFKVDVDAENVVSIYKQIKFNSSYANSRCYLVNGTLYITGQNEIKLESFR